MRRNFIALPMQTRLSAHRFEYFQIHFTVENECRVPHMTRL